MDYPLSRLLSFHPLSDAFIADVRSRMRRIVVKKNHTIHHSGSICRDVWLIELGMLACYDEDSRTGKSYCSWIMRTGDFVTAVESFNNHTVSTETILALEPCLLWAITKEDLDHLTETYPEFSVVRQRLTDYYHIQSRMNDTKRKRPPEEFFAYYSAAYPEIVQEAPITVLAAFMGVSRSTLYKIMNEAPGKGGKARGRKR